jgi:hypothetical protein
VNACDAELCPFWSGAGCDCSVFGISDDERHREQRAQGILPDVDRFEP